MCKFTYLGYEGCEEPERHYLIRREKCTAKAHLKHWCAPHEQEEVPLAEEAGNLLLPCPMCADIPIIHDQPLLEIAHSRRSVLPAPYYDAATGKYSRHPRHRAHNNNSSTPNIGDMPTALVPKPLNMARVNRVHFDRSASESAVNRIKHQESSPDYRLPAATYHSPDQQQLPLLPATTYKPSASEGKLPKPLPMPQPITATPPSSREGSLSPPQSRMTGVIRTTPPGESSRRELDSLRERARAAAAKDSKPSTPASQVATDRSRSDSGSSTLPFGHTDTLPPPPLPPRRTPSRKPSLASSTKSHPTTSTPPSKSNSINSHTSRRPQRPRQDSTTSTASRSPPSESLSSSDTSSLADRVKDTAFRTIIGFGGGHSRTASPERGRRPHRLGSSSEWSDRSPTVWRPTIGPPQLQNDSLGMTSNDIVQSFKQRLVPFAPSSKTNSPKTRNETAAVHDTYSPPRPKTPHPLHDSSNKTPVVLRLYPNKANDEKVAMAAFNNMFAEEQKALLKARHELPAASVDSVPTGGNNRLEQQSLAPAAADVVSDKKKHRNNTNNINSDDVEVDDAVLVDNQTLSEMLGGAAGGGGDPFAMAGVGRSATMISKSNNKALPATPTLGQLRRVKTGQVKTVTVMSPAAGAGARKRAYTSDVVVAGGGAAAAAAAPPPTAVKVTAGALFKFAGVGGARAQEFEIVSGGLDGAGQAF